MIVFSRAVGQTFQVANIVVTVKTIEGDAVILEFDASSSDRIQKSELYGVVWIRMSRPEFGYSLGEE